MTINPKDLLSGELAEWQVKSKLGSGGFKDVYLIEKGTRQEALKITSYYDSSLAGDMEPEEIETMYRARTEREYQLLKEFGGGCVASLGSIPLKEGTIGGHPFSCYSEEFLPGITLDKVNSHNKTNRVLPSIQIIQSIFLTGLHVIERIWNKKIVHRDIKPQNIMMTGLQERPVVFFDLGIAFDRSGSSLTAQTLGPGTLRYRAPESLDPDYRASIDFRCDLFSLAVTVYEFAAGFHPIHHGSMSDGETVYRLLKRNAEPLFNHRTDLGEQFCTLVDNCLHKRPALRPNRINDIKRMLEA